jgi:hypothetical protein
MAGTKRKYDGRSSDLSFSWMFSNLGPEWKQWQLLASEWITVQHKSTSGKINALTIFFDKYLSTKALYAADLKSFFKGSNGHRCSSNEFLPTLQSNGISNAAYLSNTINKVHEFVDWVIEHHFSVKDDKGDAHPITTNPISKLNLQQPETETVRTPLPYRYIQDLRQILCPTPNREKLVKIKNSLKYDDSMLPSYNYCHFSDWVWAQKQIGCGERGIGGDWFEVDSHLIDNTDPDCVWRSKEINRKNKKITIYQMWSPVRAMVIFMKLHLPLRTYQVRFLDSGEADTWRFESGHWVINKKHGFIVGNKKRPFSKGVFRRIKNPITVNNSTGLYISTNKTADQNKSEFECGYVIPWQHNELLYWLEKLRNWQEKYNPIPEPTSCTTLQKKHFGQTKSEQSKKNMGNLCFLFRHASAKGADRLKPIPGDQMISRFWYALLEKLQNQLSVQGITLDDDSQVNLVKGYSSETKKYHRIATYFPLHSLRVSLITAYTMDTQLPLPVISKLLAGHTRLLMTIYYNKITPSAMAEKMDEAEAQLEAKSKQSVLNFLKDASMEQIKCKMVYHKEDSVQAALVNRNPIGWEERATGICLVGGNTVKSDEISTLGGCWNGGELIRDATSAFNRIYDSVPHGPENCIRCRWFITEARYLTALNAQFNQLSYKAHQAANLSVEIEGELEALKDEQFFCEEQGAPFTKHADMQVLQRRYEKQQVEADEYAKDWIACFELIGKIIHVEESRNDDDTKDKLIAIGNEQDISHALRFVETESELLHLSLLCDDAEFFPDLQDELRKTPAIEKRSRQLSRVLMKKGFEPIFMEMDEKQQIIAGNAMLRQMAKIADPDDKLEGYRKVANYIEAGEYLEENKLFNAGMNALTDKALHLENLTQPAPLEG